jgi:ankyrin repeat protein
MHITHTFLITWRVHCSLLSQDGKSALMHAANSSTDAMVTTLLEAGASVLDASKVCTSVASTAMLISLWLASHRMEELL